jgi:glutamine synthetase
MNKSIEMNPNPLVQYLNKPPHEFTKEDLIRYVEDNDIEMINFRYVGEDDRLKTLNFVINDREHLDQVLTAGERVDGSSLFSYIEAGKSDLYVIPRYRTAFLNPFSEIPTIDILCSFYNQDGRPCESAPENILRKAAKSFTNETGMEFQAMGELEYYVINDVDHSFEATDQKNYHEAEPFAKMEQFRRDAMLAIAQSGGKIKYGHSEVGNFTKEGLVYEQNEVEFLPVNVEDAADQLVVAKWIIRTLAFKYGYQLTFAPKITVGKAGSGLHVHTKIVKEGQNMMVDQNGLSDVAKKAIAGYLDLAPSLTAFGNTNPTSYFRLVPHQEAPTNICWGDRNRSVLVRVPLGWTGNFNMAADANPLEAKVETNFSQKQTVEFRCPDGSASVYLLLAGLTVAARHGLTMDNALEYAEKTYVDVNIFEEEHKEKMENLDQLPASCFESAARLKEQRDVYAKFNVFPDAIIDGILKNLEAFNDANIREELGNDEDKILALVRKYIHCG